MKSITVPLSELKGLDFNEVLRRFDPLDDDQACNSEEGGDSDADDMLQVTASMEPAEKRPRRGSTLWQNSSDVSSVDLSTSSQASTSNATYLDAGASTHVLKILQIILNVMIQQRKEYLFVLFFWMKIQKKIYSIKIKMKV
ncbi:uncharacterized protein LOC134543700 [Bacillus rossius redtenbacheri]|uniref:uncharacterized protein LOC134543700 n=1 Tax=Bacillus rossius redtenbacheri TaxID=93214 RepID=UPI002FDD69F3